MNTKTAKLLKRYARVVGANYRTLKREWIVFPKDKKAQARVEMKEAVVPE